jgi:uncharacterized protein YdeI (YjbR/CyaY-like superfamily)
MLNTAEEILEFKDRMNFRSWLEKNHEQKESIWIRLNKVDTSGLKAPEALEEALCFGWIDSIVKRQDDTYYLKKFSPRRAKSNWSDFNKRLVGKLKKQGKMAEPGLKAVEIARKNGSWDKPDELPDITDEMYEKLRAVLNQEGLETARFDALSPSQRKNYAFYYFMAKKEETRLNRLKRIIDSIENGPVLF